MKSIYIVTFEDSGCRIMDRFYKKENALKLYNEVLADKKRGIKITKLYLAK